MEYKKRILERDKMVFGKLDSVAVYSDYLMKGRQMIRELDELKVKFRNRGQWGALVAAVKQKKDVYDSVIKLGQDFGFIDKKVAELKVSAEMSVTPMTEADVKKEVEDEVKKLTQLAEGKIIDMRPELLGVVDEQEVKKFLPNNVKLVEHKKRKKKPVVKTKIEVTLKKRI